MSDDSQKLLQLLHLADSAVPIGSTAHSFGLETLVADEELKVDRLEQYLRVYLAESGVLEAGYCRAAHRLFDLKEDDARREWLRINAELSALKPARESRAASATLGRRFLQLVASLERHDTLEKMLAAAKETKTEIHHCAAFGLCGGALGIECEATVLAYLQQNVMGLVSACQRLMPLGQQGASGLLWRLKPAIAAAAHKRPVDEITCFTPLLDLGGMRHPFLMTRLFIS